jgi:hemerythrin
MHSSKYVPPTCLGIPWIDTAHDALANAMARLTAAPDDEFASHYELLVAAVEADFRNEEDVMEAMSFAGLKAHREAHAHALAALHRADAQMGGGAVGAGRQTLAALAEWFTLHQATMDLALTEALKASQQGEPRTHLPADTSLGSALTPL